MDQDQSRLSPQYIHALRTAQTIHLQLSQMADQKASILMGATFLIFTIAIGQARGGMVPPLPLAILGGFAFVSAILAVACEVLAQIGEDYKSAFRRLRGQGLVDEPLFEGIAETLVALDKGGWLLGVATGKSDAGLASCLRHHGLSDHFVTLQTADRHPSKPHPSMVEQAIAEAGAAPHTTAVIGDTSFDMAMARAAGAHAIGVVWGYHTPDELVAAGAAALAGHASELPAHLERL